MYKNMLYFFMHAFYLKKTKLNRFVSVTLHCLLHSSRCSSAF